MSPDDGFNLQGLSRIGGPPQATALPISSSALPVVRPSGPPQTSPSGDAASARWDPVWVRRLSQIIIFSPQRRRGHREVHFFVCRETTTNKNISILRARSIAQSPSPDWAKILAFAYSASLRWYVRILICDNRRNSAVKNSLHLAS